MRQQQGFTLLELLVALVVLGFLVAGLSEGVRYGVRAAGAQARLIDGRSELDATDRTLRSLLAQADPGNAHAPALTGGPGGVAFTTRLPAGADRGGPADVALRVEGGRLMLRWMPHRYGVPFAPAQNAQTIELLRGVEGLEAAYWSGSWRREWAERDLPALIRLRLVFPPGDPRHWPDIVVAPMRQRPS